MSFTQRIMLWYKNHQRELPWRETNNPYKTWLSEIILQQTRISQGIQYYYRFLEKFPDVESLAKASEDEVLALWQGLGYYSRARNLHHTARTIVNDHNGEFPQDHKKLLSLKGVGSYTAAAIASMAFSMPHAAVDGNVARVISRYFGIEEPIDHPKIKKSIEETAQSLLDINDPGGFNQAMMDFGSMVCKPAAPLCNQCPLAMDCKALFMKKTNTIPYKAKKVSVKQRYFHFFLLSNSEGFPKEFFIEKRKGNDIWKNLYQLPMIETEEPLLAQGTNALNPLCFLEEEELLALNDQLPMQFSHILTHQKIEARFYHLRVKDATFASLKNQYASVDIELFYQMGKPVLITKYLNVLENNLNEGKW